MTLLPRLLDSSMKEISRLTPISLSLALNMAPMSTAEMKLPMGESGVKVGSYIELFVPKGSAGVFRCARIVDGYGGTKTVSLMHGLSSMADSIIPAAAEDVTTTAREAFDFVVGYQSMWRIGMFEIPADKTVTWSYDYSNVEKAFLDLLDRFPGYMATFDQTTFPWTVNIVAVSPSVSSEARLTRNLSTLDVEEDWTTLCTRLYIPGRDAPLDADTIGTYGVVGRKMDADEDLSEENITTAAMEYLEKHKRPELTVSLSAIDLSEATGEPQDSFTLGRMCRVCLPDYGQTITQRIVSLEWVDVYASPNEVRVTLANAAKNTATALDGLIVETSVLKNRLFQQGKDIRVLASTIDLNAEDILSLRAGVDDNAASIVLTNDLIDAQAKKIALKADKIDLKGFVTMEDFQALSGQIGDLTTGIATASWIKTQNLDVTIMADIAGMRFGGQTMSLKSKNVVTSIGTLTQSKRYLNVQLADGSSAQLDIVTDVSFDYTTGAISYLGYDVQ